MSSRDRRALALVAERRAFRSECTELKPTGARPAVHRERHRSISAVIVADVNDLSDLLAVCAVLESCRPWPCRSARGRQLHRARHARQVERRHRVRLFRRGRSGGGPTRRRLLSDGRSGEKTSSAITRNAAVRFRAKVTADAIIRRFCARHYHAPAPPSFPGASACTSTARLCRGVPAHAT